MLFVNPDFVKSKVECPVLNGSDGHPTDFGGKINLTSKSQEFTHENILVYYQK